MIDLVTDFKELINKSTDDTIVALKKIYINLNLEINRKFINNVNKYYIIMNVWNKKLKVKFNNADISRLLDNILLDYCSILNCVILSDEKLLNFLYRNIIESALRIISGDLKTREIDNLFNDISKNSVGTKEKELLQMYSSQLKSIYNNNCLFIHADTQKIPENITNLFEYNNNSNENKEKYLEKDFERVNIDILCIYQIIYYEIYLNLKSNAKGLMDEIIPYDYRLRFGEFEKEKRKYNISKF